MPIIKSAIKKMRQDEKKTLRNQGLKTGLKSAISKAKKSQAESDLKEAFSALDKAAKKHLIHKNSASRLKSRLASGIAKSSKEVKAPKEVKVVTAKKALKKKPAKKK